MLADILYQLNNLIAQLRYKFSNKTLQNRLYDVAAAALGHDVTPHDNVPDEVACAESVTELLSRVVKFPIIPGTYTLNERLRKDTRFVRLMKNPGPGAIIISPTGSGNGKIRGHVGIVGESGLIYSNDSRTGWWVLNYTIESWEKRWDEYGEMPIYYYVLID